MNKYLSENYLVWNKQQNYKQSNIKNSEKNKKKWLSKTWKNTYYSSPLSFKQKGEIKFHEPKLLFCLWIRTW